MTLWAVWFQGVVRFASDIMDWRGRTSLNRSFGDVEEGAFCQIVLCDGVGDVWGCLIA